MKQRIQGIIIGLMIAVLLFSVTAVASGSTMIEVFYNGIKLYIDGAEITPKDVNGNTVLPFIHNGTTYLPVRAIGEAFGKTVEWDGTTQSVYVGPRPGSIQYMSDILPAYQKSSTHEFNYKEYSVLNSGGVDSFALGGVKYVNGISFSGNAWAVYNLNSRYTSLSGTISQIDGSSSHYTDDAVVRFFCDNKLVEEIPISADMMPLTITINLVGVNQLKIETNYISSSGRIGIGNPILK